MIRPQSGFEDVWHVSPVGVVIVEPMPTGRSRDNMARQNGKASELCCRCLGLSDAWLGSVFAKDRLEGRDE
jgi:hypothetical protein